MEPVALLQANIIQELFEANVFRLLVKKELIGKDLITKMRSRKHTGFQVYAGPKITEKEDILCVGLNIIRPPASAGRLQVNKQDGLLKYLAKGAIPNDRCDSLLEPDGQVFDPLEWIAKVTSHIPQTGTQILRYCGRYSNASRGKAAKRAPSVDQTANAPNEVSENQWILQRKATWAALIKLI